VTIVAELVVMAYLGKQLRAGAIGSMADFKSNMVSGESLTFGDVARKEVITV